jgi:phage terminase large subunit GpA-like protein
MSEWFRAKRGGPAEQQPFVNQVLGRTWKTSINAVDADVLRTRVEPFGLPTPTRAKVIIPHPVLLITVGADVQDERIEASILGWPRTGAPFVLGHVTFDGNTLDDEVWSNFDQWLRTAKWRNERGWRMGIDAVAVDSGGREGRTQKIYNWCHARHSRRIYAVKGVSGPRKLWDRAKKVKGDMRLVNVAVDVAKTTVLDMIAREPFPREFAGDRDPAAAHFSDSLADEWFEQVTNERRRLRYRGNRPTYVFELARPGSPNEALDCCVYGYAVRLSPAVISIDLEEREKRAPEPEDGQARPHPPRRSAGEWAAEFARLSDPSSRF